MTTRRDYIEWAQWISENTLPQNRKTILKFVYFIAEKADQTRGNKKLFHRSMFLNWIKAYDEERVVLQ